MRSPLLSSSNAKAAAFLRGPSCVQEVRDPDRTLANQDLVPVTLDKRSFSTVDFLSLWLGVVVGVPSYYLAGSLVVLGMSWWQGVLTVMAANVILLIPLVLTGIAGTKYGIPFPVLCRASFGIRGAHVATILRSLVACGWFGIETWIGGQGFHVLLSSLSNDKLANTTLRLMGTSLAEWGCFFAFWLLQIAVIWKGIESIRKLEKYSAPVLTTLSIALLIWAYTTAGGLGAMLSAPSQFGTGGAKEGQFWLVFFPALTANIGSWSPVSLSIADFTRYAKSQGEQMIGHLGLPIFMGLFTFLGLAVTSSTEVIYGQVISNPVELLGQIGGILPIFISVVGLTLATVTTNIAANITAPANAFLNINPNLFSFRTGSLLTAVVGILFGPWQFMRNSETYIKTWLIGYTALLLPLNGIILVDFFILRSCKLDVDALYSTSCSEPYWYCYGFNFRALISLVAGIVPSVPGFLYTVGLATSVPNSLIVVYENAWLLGFLAGLLYWILCALQGKHTMIQNISSNSGEAG